MPRDTSTPQTPSPARQASPALLAAALSGLLGAAAACGSDPPRGDSTGSGGSAAGGGAGAGGSAGTASDSGAPPADASTFYVNVVSTTPISFDQFTELCEERGGFVTTAANCAGANLCKGLSYMEDGTVLTDHSCRGLSNCAGLSCLDTPADTGLTGADIYGGTCGGCHNTSLIPGEENYVVFVPPGGSPAEHLARFEESSLLRLMSIVAFGTQGINQDGTAFSNMPSYRQEYSRAEIQRAVEYVRTLEKTTVVYSTPGESDGGGGPTHGAGGAGP